MKIKFQIENCKIKHIFVALVLWKINLNVYHHNKNYKMKKKWLYQKKIFYNMTMLTKISRLYRKLKINKEIYFFLYMILSQK